MSFILLFIYFCCCFRRMTSINTNIVTWNQPVKWVSKNRIIFAKNTTSAASPPKIPFKSIRRCCAWLKFRFSAGMLVMWRAQWLTGKRRSSFSVQNRICRCISCRRGRSLFVIIEFLCTFLNFALNKNKLND